MPELCTRSFHKRYSRKSNDRGDFCSHGGPRENGERSQVIYVVQYTLKFAYLSNMPTLRAKGVFYLTKQ